MRSKLYFECHVTIDPLNGKRLKLFTEICKPLNFRVADLVMIKSNGKDKPSDRDSFCTSRSKDFNDLNDRMVSLITECKKNSIKVRRYKIEDTILDSKYGDND